MRINLKKVVPFVALTVILTALAVVSCACDGSKSKTENPSEAPKAAPEGKTLVAYFSASGVTKKLAGEINEVVNGDLFEIVPETPYTEADLDWHDKTSRSSVEMNEKRDFRPAISSRVDNMDQYQTIYIGFPIWWYIAPTIVNSFLESYNLEGKKIITFATSGGSGMGKTLENLKPSAPKADWIEGRVLNNVDKNDIEKWVESIK